MNFAETLARAMRLTRWLLGERRLGQLQLGVHGVDVALVLAKIADCSAVWAAA